MTAIADSYGRGDKSKIGIQFKKDLRSGKYKMKMKKFLALVLMICQENYSIVQKLHIGINV